MSKTIEERLRALEDREELIKLKARYVNYNDGGWQGPTHTDPDAVADLFVEDGIWDGSPNAGYAKGRAEIKALFEHFRAVKFIVHYVTNPLIEVDGDTATGHWHALGDLHDAGRFLVMDSGSVQGAVRSDRIEVGESRCCASKRRWPHRMSSAGVKPCSRFWPGTRGDQGARRAAR